MWTAIPHGSSKELVAMSDMHSADVTSRLLLRRFLCCACMVSDSGSDSPEVITRSLQCVILWNYGECETFPHAWLESIGVAAVGAENTVIMLMGTATALTILMVVSAAWHTVNAMGCFDDCRRLPSSRVVVCEIQQGGALKQTFEPCNSRWFHSQPGASCEVCWIYEWLLCYFADMPQTLLTRYVGECRDGRDHEMSGSYCYAVPWWWAS